LPLLQLQKDLYAVMVRVERRKQCIRKDAHDLKGLLHHGRLPKEQTRGVKDLIDRVRLYEASYAHLFDFLLAIGNGIAFTIFHTYDLKQLNLRESAGGIGGKAGRRREFLVLARLLRRGCPAVLCDITSALRYGDILAWGHEGQPHPIEVKSSANRNARVARQEEAVEWITGFLKEGCDLGESMGRVTRKVPELPTRTHVAKLNRLIARAMKGTPQLEEVEPDVFYDVSCGDHVRTLDDIVERFKWPYAEFLNRHKHNENWSSYIPYTLTIQNPTHCLAFAEGQLLITVIFDFHRAVAIAERFGFTVARTAPEDVRKQIAEHPEWAPLESQFAFWIVPRPTTPTRVQSLGIGHHFFGRLFFEFMSLEWMIEDRCRAMLKRGPLAISAHGCQCHASESPPAWPARKGGTEG